MANTSATGGYLLEEGTAPLNDQSLRRFLQSVIVGVTDLEPNLVRQSWQLNPATIPDYNVDWCSFGIIAQRQDNEPAQRQLNNLSTQMQRHEEIDVLCIFYGENCQATSSSLRDGLYLTQNQEILFLGKMGLVGFSQITHVPELINNRFFDRCDITMTLRREIIRDYPILSFVQVSGTIYGNTSTKVITVDFETPL
jgi:hypothetical protein